MITFVALTIHGLMAKKTVKKVVTTDKAQAGTKKGKKVFKTTADARKVVKPTTSRRGAPTAERKGTLLFNAENYKWMAIGVGLILLGMLCMIGGKMPDPNTWDPDIIYSKRITVLGPFLVLAGLGVEIYAIFKR